MGDPDVIEMKCRRCGHIERRPVFDMPQWCKPCYRVAFDESEGMQGRGRDVYAEEIASLMWMQKSEADHLDKVVSEARATAMKRGGARKGAGRPKLDEGGTVVQTVRLTAEQKATFDMVGGVQWLRGQLDLFSEGSR